MPPRLLWFAMHRNRPYPPIVPSAFAGTGVDCRTYPQGQAMTAEFMASPLSDASIYFVLVLFTSMGYKKMWGSFALEMP
jgi:hypothetical protein